MNAIIPTDERLRSALDGLVTELERVRHILPDDLGDASESVERRARIVAMLTRSLEILVRIEKQDTDDERSHVDRKRTKKELLEHIERRLAGLAAEGGEEKISPTT